MVKGYLVDTLIGLNRIKEAKALNQEILSSIPADPHALLSNGRILIAEGKYQEALVALQKAVKSEPGSAAGHYFLGVARQSLGLSDLAKSSFAHSLELYPQMTEAAVALADLNVKSGDYDDALRLASGALKTNPSLPLAYVASAQAWLAKGDARQGEALLQEALKRDPASLPALAILLNLHVRQGRTSEAVQRISRLVQQHPQNAGLHFLLAVGYFSLKDLEKSEASVRQAITLDPRTPDAYTLLANIDFAKGSVEKANINLRAAIEINPRNVANYMALEAQYEKEGNWEEAKKLCEKAHQVDPASPLVANQLAYFYLEHGGDVNVALSLAQMAKQEMPNSLNVADTLGWAYYKLGSFELAIVQLKECVQKASDNPTFQYHLGMAYIAARHFDSAERSLQRVLKDNPNSPYAASARAALEKISKRPH